MPESIVRTITYHGYNIHEVAVDLDGADTISNQFRVEHLKGKPSAPSREFETLDLAKESINKSNAAARNRRPRIVSRRLRELRSGRK